RLPVLDRTGERNNDAFVLDQREQQRDRIRGEIRLETHDRASSNAFVRKITKPLRYRLGHPLVRVGLVSPHERFIGAMLAKNLEQKVDMHLDPPEINALPGDHSAF